MNKLLALTLLASTSLMAIDAVDNGANQRYVDEMRQQGIKVNHWVLAKPNGRPITAMDLARRLEMIFYRSYPQYANSQEIRLQFYQGSWREVLAEEINNELILADAEEKGVNVSDGEIRQQLEEMFGPNVVENLDEMGMSHHEAYEMVKKDLMVQQMQGYMVQRKAMEAINPERLLAAYDRFVETFEPTNTWEYQILSIRHEDKEIAANIAAKAEALLKENPQIAIEELATSIETEEVTVRVTDPETRELDDLADAYRKAIEPLEVGSYGAPQSQISRADGSTVYRIFHLCDRVTEELPSFDEKLVDLQNELYQEAAVAEQEAYIAKLRHNHGIDQEYLSTMVPAGFQPFVSQ